MLEEKILFQDDDEAPVSDTADEEPAEEKEEEKEGVPEDETPAEPAEEGGDTF